MVFTKLFAVVMISGIALAAPPQLLYKTLTGSLPIDPHSKDHMTTFTPDTSVVSKGCTVEERNGDKKNTETNGEWEGQVTVDSWPFTVNICTRLPDMIKALFTLEQSPINQCYDETTEVTINGGLPYPCRNFIFCNGTKLGTLMVQVSCDPNACPENNFEVFVDASFPNSTVKLVSKVVTTNPIIGKPVTIEAKLQSTSQLSANVNPPKIISAVMRVLQDDGSVITELMSVLLNNTVIGKYIPTFSDHQKSQIVDDLDQTIEVILKFITAFGDEPIQQFRTVTHVVYSALESILQHSKPSISKTYSHPVTNSEMVKFTVPVRILKTHTRNNYRYFTEVWGTDVNGTEKAICWITGLTDIQLDNSTEDNKYYNGHFDLDMNTNWMIITETLFPLHFRNFSIEETSGFVELVQNDRMEIDHDPWLFQWTASKRPEDVKITREIMEGYSPALYNSEQVTNSKLLLVHGYCSSDDPFSTDEFTNYAVFRDYDQSRDTDEFAQLIDQYARSQDIDAYSIVAHSQGGMAALHLLTYYHSGLDLTTVSIIMSLCVCMCVAYNA